MGSRSDVGLNFGDGSTGVNHLDFLRFAFGFGQETLADTLEIDVAALLHPVRISLQTSGCSLDIHVQHKSAVRSQSARRE